MRNQSAPSFFSIHFLPFFIHSLLMTHTNTLKPAEMCWCDMVFDPKTEHDGIANFNAYSNVGTFRHSGIDNFNFRNRPNLVFKSKHLSLSRTRTVRNAMTVSLAFSYECVVHNRTNFQSKSIKQYRAAVAVAVREREGKSTTDNYKTNSTQMESKVFILSYRNTYLKQNK